MFLFNLRRKCLYAVGSDHHSLALFRENHVCCCMLCFFGQVLETAFYKVPIDFYEKHAIDCTEGSFKGLYYFCVRYFQKTKPCELWRHYTTCQSCASGNHLCSVFTIFSLIKCEQEDDFLKGIVHPQARCTWLSSFRQIELHLKSHGSSQLNNSNEWVLRFWCKIKCIHPS